MKAKFLTIVLILTVLTVFASESYACGGGNNPPVADLEAVPEWVDVNETVMLDGSGSYDPDGYITKYEWDFTSDGTYDYNETSSDYGDGAFDGRTTHIYSEPNVYTATLRVTDNLGATGTDTCTVKVGRVYNINQNTWYSTIQAALDDANNGDTIEVDEGTYDESIDFNGVSCTLTSTDPNDWNVVANTIIDANDSDANVVTFISNEDVNSVLKGFTITGGYRGIYCDGVSPTISNCVITDNNCASGSGGGIYDCNSSSATVTNCFFIENNANYGGGMYNTNSSPTVTSCVFVENTADANGGGTYNDNSTSVLINCTFSENYADDDGGGMYNYGASSCPNVTNCIFWGNDAGDSNDEVYNASSADPNFRYCDIKGCGGSGGGWDANFGTDGGGNIDSDPNFENADNPVGWDYIFGTYDDGLRLQTNSPCIDVADGDAAPSTDIIGLARVDVPYVDNNGVGSPNYVDIGAYESPTIWFVDVNAAADGNGTSWDDAFDDLQEALAVPTMGDEIWVAAGTYKPDSSDPNNRSKSFGLVGGVGIYGGFAGAETGRYQRDWTTYQTILSGDINVPDDQNDNSYHVVTGASNAILDGFTITGGNGSSVGGGIYCLVTSPTIRNCVITNNKATYGAGMCNLLSSPTVTNCTFSGNEAASGGGMYNVNDSSPVVTNCVFIANKATSASEGGGGMYNYCLSITVTNCTFSGNESANYGGGMYNDVYYYAMLTNCIFWGNDAANQGDEIYNYDKVVIRYSDVNGCGGSGPNNWNPNFGIDAGGNIDSNPCFADINDPDGADDTFATFDDGLRLKGSSPCIDAADGYVGPSTDILGLERLDISDVNNTGTGDPNYVDMGAYEYHYPAPGQASNPNPANQEPNVSTIADLSWTAGSDTTSHNVYFGTNFNDVNDANDPNTLPGRGNQEANSYDPDTMDSATTYYWRIDEVGLGGTTTGTVWSFSTPNVSTWYVKHNATGSENGTSWVNAFTKIQDAINAANTGNEIWVAEGTYVLSSGMSINKAISIYGGFDGTETVLGDRDAFPGNTHTTTVDGDNIGWILCFDITDCTTIDGFTITNAGIDYFNQGTGIYCSGASASTTITNCNITNNVQGIACLSSSSPTISNCTFSGNGENNYGFGIGIFSSSSPTVTNCEFNQNPGGGIRCSDSSPTISDCVFTGNGSESISSSSGGAISCGDSTTIEDCEFTGNKSGSLYSGGAIVCGDSTTIEDCEFTDNTAGNGGGGAISCGGSTTISGCVFTGNVADGLNSIGVGGAIRCVSSSSPTIEDCEFTDNTAERDGGAIYCTTGSSSSPKIERCVFNGNEAGSNHDGGGLYASYSTPEVINCLFINNEAHNGGGIATWHSNGSTVINCTFYGNASLGTHYDDGGGAVYAKTINTGYPCYTTLTNCILWGNTAANDGHEVCSDGHNSTSKAIVTLEYCDIQDTTGWMFEVNAYSEVDYLNNDNIYADPDFVSTGNLVGNDDEWATSDDGLMIQSTSECKDYGDDVTGYPYYISDDITGNDRKINGDVDIGAYEYGN